MHRRKLYILTTLISLKEILDGIFKLSFIITVKILRYLIIVP